MKKRLFFPVLLLLLSLPAHAAEPPVTRGEFVTLMWESQGGVPFDITAHPFTDLEGRDEAAQAVAWAYDLELVKGVGNALSAPDRPLTREECATFLRRLDAHLGLDTFLPEGATLCNDDENVSPWAQDDLYWACIMGRMDWLENRLAPKGPVGLDAARALF